MTAVLTNDELTVIPGDQVTCTVQVRNTGSVVDEYTFEVLGPAARWATVEPPLLTLYPATEGAATVRFAPPRQADVAAGPVPFGLRVASREDPSSTTVEEGALNIAGFLDAFAELVPRSAHGRRAAMYELALDNRGNSRINAPLAAVDPDNVLRFRLDPPTLVAEPNTATFAKVMVRPRRTFWRGPAQTKAFRVAAQPEGLPPLVADGTLLQEALVPEWLPEALLAALGLLALLVVIWLVALKPQVKSIAKKAARKEVASAPTQAAIKAAATKAAQQAGAGGSPGGGVQAGQPSAGTGGPTAGGTAPVSQANALRGVPIDDRLTTTGSGTAAYSVPAGKVLQMTDIVLENTPNDDKGTLSVQRSGAVLLNVALENFRDLDYHFVAPIMFAAGQRLEIVTNVTACTRVCQPALYFSGYLADATA